MLLVTPSPYDRRIWNGLDQELARSMGVTVASWPGLEEHVPPPFRQSDLAVELREFAGADLVLTAGSDSAVAVALADDPRVRGLVLVGAVRLMVASDQLVDEFAERLQRTVATIPPELRDAVARKDAADVGRLMAGFHADVLPPEALRLARDVVTDNAAAFWLDQRLSDYETDWVEQLAEVSVPALFVASAADSISVRLVEALAARCPRGRMAYVDARSGLPWLEYGPGLARIIGDFADEVLGPAT